MKFSGAKSTVFFLSVFAGLQIVATGCLPAVSATESNRSAGSQDATAFNQKGGDLATEANKEAAAQESGRTTDVAAQAGSVTPSYACELLDPSKTITMPIPGGPAGLAIPVSKYVKTPGMVSYENASTAKFKFSVFKHGGQWTLEWPSGYGAYFIHNYEATITAADTAKCVITARETSAPEQRTMLGCFDPQTKIRMANGKDRAIDSIAIGDLVLNPVTGKTAPVVRVTKGPEAGKGLYLIGFKGKGARNATTVKVTSKHPFMTENGLRTASQLGKGDRILTAGGTFRKLDIVRSMPEKAGQQVVNIVLGSSSFEAADHMVLADGVVSGDLLLQERLENMTALSLNNRAK